MMQRAATVLLTIAMIWLTGWSLGSDEPVPADILTKANPVQESEAVLDSARSLYKESCVMCHGEEGKGDGPMASMFKTAPADISNPEVLRAVTDGEIYWLISKGKKPMPQFESKMTEEERWGLVHLTRKLSNTEPNTTPAQ